MSQNYNYDLVVLFGQPVAENPTGEMQEAGFAEAGLRWRYLNIEVPPEKLAEAMTGVRVWSIKGMNLTIPHKVAIMEHLDEISKDAQIIGAVNTVRREGDKLIGENTDGKGFLRGVRLDAGVDPKDKRVVMIGAGGAGRAIGTELVLAGARELVVVNRTVERGEAMVAHLKEQTGANVKFKAWEGTYVVPDDVDIFVNSTSIGLYPNVEMPPVDLSNAKSDMLVCDAVFNPPVTPLLQAAMDLNLPTLDGLSMLVYQGVIGFEFWTGQTADEAVMKEALRKALGV